MEKQRVMVRPEMTRGLHAGHRSVEPAAQHHTIDTTGMHPEADDPASELVPHDEHRVGVWSCGTASAARVCHVWGLRTGRL
jgi:hypothetical protein